MHMGIVKTRPLNITLTILLLILSLVYGFYNKLEATYYTYKDSDIPVEFNGYRIAFVSDFHCSQNGEQQSELISLINGFNPNIVVFTGDMIDGDHLDLTPVKDLLFGLKGKYLMYAVNGNHEKDNVENYAELLRIYSEYGITYLLDTSDLITKNGASIGIYGGSFRNYYPRDPLEGPADNGVNFNILLYHDATAFSYINSLGYDLILAGHTHGGIIRLPFIGGLISTHLTLIAHYESGMYYRNGTAMLSSRGIGDAALPRYNNRPEIICLKLKTEE